MTTINTADRLSLRVTESNSRDVGRAIVRMDPQDLAKLNMRIGDIVLLQGEKTCVGKAMLLPQELRGQSRIQLDGLLREAVDRCLDQFIEVSRAEARPADSIRLQALRIRPNDRDLDYIANLLDGLPALEGGMIRATLFGNEAIDFRVVETSPKGPVVIAAETRLSIENSQSETPDSIPSFEDIGGAKPQLARIREMIEMPLRYPEVFERLGVDPPRGVLLYGPPGCGKTLIARAIAQEADAKFFIISGPEIIHKHYGESEAHLRKIFQEANKQAPSIIFIDEIDAIAPRRENAAGDVERRVVAQLLTLMDGLRKRENVIVVAATNLPNAIDPALRRPGRFDREIEITVPDRAGRLQILEIHTRGMPLANDVHLGHLASITHGFVGADLALLCREAAMSCLRKVFATAGLKSDRTPYSMLSTLVVSMQDFLAGFQAVEPSGVREVMVEVPNVRWDDIGGLQSVKQKLREAITWPIEHHDLFDKMKVKPPRGLLLSGPPGCGKTLLAKAAATETKVNFISVKGPEVLSKFVGESERALRNVFAKARQAAPCIIFFDEIDGLCSNRDMMKNESGVAHRVLSQLLTEMDGIEELSGVFILAATNREDMVDPALRRFGRFEQTVEIGLPDRESRLSILNVHLRDRPLSSDINLEDIANRTEGYSGADLAAVCSSAARSAIRRIVQSSASDEQLIILSSDINLAIADVKGNP